MKKRSAKVAVPWSPEGPWAGVYESLMAGDERLEQFADLFWDSRVDSIGAGESLFSWDERLRIVFRELLGPVKEVPIGGRTDEAEVLKIFDLFVDGKHVASCGMCFPGGEFFYSDLKGNCFPIDNSNGQVSQIMRSMRSGLSKEGKWQPRRGDFEFVLRSASCKWMSDGEPLDRTIGRSIAKSAVEVEPYWFPYLSESLRADKNLVMYVLTKQPMMLEFAAGDLKADREVVSRAVAQSGEALKYASEALQDDAEVVLLAAGSKYSEDFFAFASRRLRRDRSFVRRVVSESGRALLHAAEKLRGDKETVLAAVSQYGLALECASDELRRDKDVVLAAFSQDSSALDFASDELKQDKDFVLAAVSEYGPALESASDALKADKEVVLAAIGSRENSGQAIVFAHKKFLKSRAMVLRALKSTECPGQIIQSVHKKLLSDKQVALLAVSKEGTALQYFDDNIRGDRDVGLVALQEDVNAYQFLSEPLKRDKQLALLAVKNNISMVEELPERLKNSQRMILAAFLSENNKACRGSFAEVFPQIGSELMKKKSFVLQLFRHEPSILGFIPLELKVDKAFMSEVWGVRNLGDAEEVRRATPRDLKLARLIARMESSFAVSKMRGGETRYNVGPGSTLNVACLCRVAGKTKNGGMYASRILRLEMEWRKAVIVTYECRRADGKGGVIRLARLWYVRNGKNETDAGRWDSYEPFYYAAGRNRHAFLDEVIHCAIDYRD